MLVRHPVSMKPEQVTTSVHRLLERQRRHLVCRNGLDTFGRHIANLEPQTDSLRPTIYGSFEAANVSFARSGGRTSKRVI
jgi:hypothetical protein